MELWSLNRGALGVRDVFGVRTAGKGTQGAHPTRVESCVCTHVFRPCWDVAGPQNRVLWWRGWSGPGCVGGGASHLMGLERLKLVIRGIIPQDCGNSTKSQD
eukprot:962761-Prymnesium_polylepis.2